MAEEYRDEDSREDDYYYYDDRTIEVIDCVKDNDVYTSDESTREFRQAAGQHVEWDEHSEDEYLAAARYTTEPNMYSAEPFPSKQPNLDCMKETTDICVIAGTEYDNNTVEGQEELLRKMWQAARPPTKLTIRASIVSARQLEILRGQLTGELPRKSKSNFVKCDEETCQEICKYVGVLRKNQAKRAIERVRSKGRMVHRDRQLMARLKSNVPKDIPMFYAHDNHMLS